MAFLRKPTLQLTERSKNGSPKGDQKRTIFNQSYGLFKRRIQENPSSAANESAPPWGVMVLVGLGIAAILIILSASWLTTLLIALPLIAAILVKAYSWLWGFKAPKENSSPAKIAEPNPKTNSADQEDLKIVSESSSSPAPSKSSLGPNAALNSEGSAMVSAATKVPSKASSATSFTDPTRITAATKVTSTSQAPTSSKARAKKRKKTYKAATLSQALLVGLLSGFLSLGGLGCAGSAKKSPALMEDYWSGLDPALALLGSASSRVLWHKSQFSVNQGFPLKFSAPPSLNQPGGLTVKWSGPVGEALMGLAKLVGYGTKLDLQVSHIIVALAPDPRLTPYEHLESLNARLAPAAGILIDPLNKILTLKEGPLEMVTFKNPSAISYLNSP